MGEKNTTLVALVTEFPQDTRFQWRAAWNDEMMRKYNCFVKSVAMGPEYFFWYPNTHIYWDWIKKADLVFAYCSRTSTEKTDKGQPWLWYKLPNRCRELMKPEAKLICQFDDDLIFVHDEDFVWWRDNPLKERTPQQFFDETKILDVGDMYFYVTENPKFTPYCHKPFMYFPLPQAMRYYNFVASPTKGNNVALIRHSSRVASVVHTVKNVVRNHPVTYFNSRWGGAIQEEVKMMPSGSKIYDQTSQMNYMKLLQSQCHIGIDDAEGYFGWSRFVMECAIADIPCIGSFHANKLIFPELFTQHKDYKLQKELLERTFTDRDWYSNILVKGKQYVKTELDPEKLCKNFIDIAKSIGVKLQSEIEDENIFDKVMFMDMLEKILPFHIIPTRPANNQEIWDHHQKKQITNVEWDECYKEHYEKFISDDTLYKEIIREVMEKRNQMNTGRI